MKICGIYKIVHVATGRCYVGQSQDIAIRVKKHHGMLRRKCHHSIHLQRAWDKYGHDAFEFVVLEKCPSEDLNEREQYWMDKLGSVFNRLKTAGSSRGFVMSEEQKAKLSAFNKGKVIPAGVRKKISATLKNRYFSPEHRAKISEARKRVKFTDEWIENLKKGWDTPKRRAGILRANEKKRGRKLTEEHRAKLRAAHARRKQVAGAEN